MMKKAKIVFMIAVLCICLLVMAGCTEVQVGSVVRIENAEGKGTVVFDLPIDYSDGNEHYLPNGTEGLANAVTKVVVTDMGVDVQVTVDTEYLLGDGGQTVELDHVYITIEFDNIDEYNAIMKKLGGDRDDFIPSEMYYDEAEGGYVFKEHSTSFTNVVIYLRQLICADENVDLTPDGHDSHTPDEAANSWDQYIYVGNGTSDYFPHYDYRNEAIGHTYMYSIGNFDAAPQPTETQPTETQPQPTETQPQPTESQPAGNGQSGTEKPADNGNLGLWIGIAVAVAAVAVIVLKKKKA